MEGDVAEAAEDFVGDCTLVGFGRGLVSDGKTHVGTGIVPGDGGDEFFSDEPLGKIFGCGKGDGVAVGGGSSTGGRGVEEKAASRFFELKAEALEGRDKQVHAAGVFLSDGASDFGVVEAPGYGVLDGEVLAGVGVIFDVAVSAYEPRVALWRRKTFERVR